MGEERVYFVSYLTVCHEGRLGLNLEAGTKAVVMDECAAYWLALQTYSSATFFFFFYKFWDLIVTPHVSLLGQSLLKMSHRLAYRQSDGGIFSIEVPNLFPDDSGLC